jgi:hypothetical protein
MTEFRARIKSYRMKAGGADIRVLHNPMPNEFDGVEENYRGKIIQHARWIAETDPQHTMDGFIVIGLWDDGTRSVGYRIPKRIPRELVPHYVAEILRTDAITDNEFDQKFEWRES